MNFLADIVLVGHFRLGAGGSAITNVFAQALSVFLGVMILKRQHLPFPFSRIMIRKDAVKGLIPSCRICDMSVFSFRTPRK